MAPFLSEALRQRRQRGSLTETSVLETTEEGSSGLPAVTAATVAAPQTRVWMPLGHTKKTREQQPLLLSHQQQPQYEESVAPKQRATRKATRSTPSPVPHVTAKGTQ